jgi:hypothetical protein
MGPHGASMGPLVCIATGAAALILYFDWKHTYIPIERPHIQGPRRAVSGRTGPRRAKTRLEAHPQPVRTFSLLGPRKALVLSLICISPRYLPLSCENFRPFALATPLYSINFRLIGGVLLGCAQ